MNNQELRQIVDVALEATKKYDPFSQAYVTPADALAIEFAQALNRNFPTQARIAA